MRVSLRMRRSVVGFFAVVAVAQPPQISTLLKPVVLKRVLEEREVMTHASLDDDHYHFYASVLIRASLGLTRSVFTDYQVYSKLIPYVDRAEYSAETHTLKIEGGIWKFKLLSTVLFEEKGDRWIHYKIIDGSFTGLAGDIYFEPQGEKGTAVYISGEQRGRNWPPRLVIERGAEIVFTFTGRKMRSYVEEKKYEGQIKTGSEKIGPEQIPQPRTRIKVPD